MKAVVELIQFKLGHHVVSDDLEEGRRSVIVSHGKRPLYSEKSGSLLSHPERSF